MSDVAPAPPKPGGAEQHELQDAPEKQLQVPAAASDSSTSPQNSTIGQTNGVNHRNNGDTNIDKSDSEAETDILSGKEEGQSLTARRAIKLEQPHQRQPNDNHQAEDSTMASRDPQKLHSEETFRQPSLKRKRTMPDHGHANRPDTSGNSSNLSSTVSSPAPQVDSSKTTDSASNRSRSSPPLNEVAEDQGRKANRPTLEKGNSHGHTRGGRGDRASEPVNGRKRRDTRSATHYDEPGHRSESPPSRNNNRAQSIHSNHLQSGVTKRKKVPAPLNVERRRKASEDTHPESDGDSSVHSHPHLQKLTSADNNAMSPAKMISHKKNRDRSGQTLLARACRSGDVVEVGKWLQERRQDLDVADYAENTPLQIAALEGNTDVVQLLLEAGCDTNCKNIDKETPLIDAVENGHLEVVKLLLNAGLDPRQTNAKGQEPLDLINTDLDDAEEIREVLQASKKEKALLRRPSEDHNRQQGTGSRDIDKTSGAASGVSPTVSSRSPPPGGTTAKRRTARSQVTDDALLWVNATPARLRDAAGKGEVKIVDHILKMRPQADTESILAAARGGHEDTLGLMLATATTDPDPEPLRSGEYKPAYSTPLLAAIGRGNASIIRLLLSQAGFDPTRRRYRNMTYHEIARDRQGANWQEEHDVLKEAYDSYRQNGGRRSNNNSPRRVRAKRADSTMSVSEPSSSPHEARKTRKPTTLKEEPSEGVSRDSPGNGTASKHAGDTTRKQGSPALASDQESAPRGPLKSKVKEGHAGSEKSLLTSGRTDSLKPKRRLMSGNDFKIDQDTKRRASHAADADPSRHKSGDSTHQHRQRRFSDSSESIAVINSDEPLNGQDGLGKKRHRVSVSPQANKSELVANTDQKQKKRQRVDSHGTAIDQDRECSFRPGAPTMVANMIAGPAAGQVPPAIPHGTAPVAFMGSNVASPVSKSPTDSYSQSSMISPVNSIDQALSHQPVRQSLQAEKVVEGLQTQDERTGQQLRKQPKEIEERATQEEQDKRHQIDAEKQRIAQVEKEEAERRSMAARHEEEEKARLEEQRQAEEAERQARLEKEQEEARVAKAKRDEELHQRMIEQERLRKEEQERRRREAEERETLRRLRLQEDEERQRLQSLPNGLRRAAELGPEEARKASEIRRWLPLRTVTTQELEPDCEPSTADDKWIVNVQAAPILAIKDLDLSQCECIPTFLPTIIINRLKLTLPLTVDTAWTRLPTTLNHRGSLWRQLRNYMSLPTPTQDPFLTATQAVHLDAETRPKFFELGNRVFWIKLADFMDIVPRHHHLTGLVLSTREMALHEFPFGKGGTWERPGGASVAATTTVEVKERAMKTEVVSPVLNGNLTNGIR